MADEAKETVVLVYGDSRTDHEAHGRVVGAMELFNADVVFHTGDLVGNGLDSGNWVIFDSITAGLRMTATFYPALGNHEYDSPLFYDRFELPGNERWYEVVVDSVSYLILDSNRDTDTLSEQYRWLKNKLEHPGDGILFTAAVFHHPPYSTGPHAEDEKNLRLSWTPLFEKYGVGVVFNGHDHSYERSYVNGVYYVVSGGGGAPLYEQARTSPYSLVFASAHHFCRLRRDGEILRVEVITPDLEFVDSFKIIESF